MYVIKERYCRVCGGEAGSMSDTVWEQMRQLCDDCIDAENINTDLLPALNTHIVRIIGHCADGRLDAFMEEMEEVVARYKDIEIKIVG